MTYQKRSKLEVGITLLGYDWETFKEEYKYVGGNTGCRLSYFMTFKLPQPTHKYHCLCQTEIVEQCYIANDEGDVLVIGNECIKHFEFDTKRYCKCGKCLNNSKYQICARCRMKLSIPRPFTYRTNQMRSYKKCKCGNPFEKSYYKICNACFRK
jgi:hypothetical protein